MSSATSFTPTSPTERPPKSRRTIMIAVDGSDQSKYAFKWSLDNLIKEDDWVILVYCMKSDKQWSEISLDETVTKDTDKAEQSRIKNLLSTFAGECSAKFISSKSIVLKGDAKLALVGKASDLHVDVMIMGSRGMGALKKAIMGSVSDYCVHNAPCPVLIVRKPNN